MDAGISAAELVPALFDAVGKAAEADVIKPTAASADTVMGADIRIDTPPFAASGATADESHCRARQYTSVTNAW
ncbi:hypothetical protein NDR87_29880 [Nocardia sp. CDC159]|uniref:Uncharacterized protein n=1 Tax=Nocardia pulmonis TaxID=2951408 RepID=A0A9X2IZK6_9NOCA|nr:MULTISPECIES: hypothetical protein [Nocardia]MCM6777608.1 hypothetical protein [Nocardia pulmonis]MCM6790588.1 hypothetical protein [Nocardia sp. CDC159]